MLLCFLKKKTLFENYRKKDNLTPALHHSAHGCKLQTDEHLFSCTQILIQTLYARVVPEKAHRGFHPRFGAKVCPRASCSNSDSVHTEGPKQ